MRARISLLLLMALALVFSVGRADAASLEGSWSGSGVVNPTDGPREKVRCRISYRRESAKVYGLTATCATRSNKVQQTGTLLMVSATSYVGDFYNPAHDISGRVRVVVRGSRQTVTFKSARGSGRVTLRRR
jgi:hypothetical protein